MHFFPPPGWRNPSKIPQDVGRVGIPGKFAKQRGSFSGISGRMTGWLAGRLTTHILGGITWWLGVVVGQCGGFLRTHPVSKAGWVAGGGGGVCSRNPSVTSKLLCSIVWWLAGIVEPSSPVRGAIITIIIIHISWNHLMQLHMHFSWSTILFYVPDKRPLLLLFRTVASVRFVAQNSHNYRVCIDL